MLSGARDLQNLSSLFNNLGTGAGAGAGVGPGAEPYKDTELEPTQDNEIDISHLDYNYINNCHDLNEISLNFNNMFNTSYSKKYLYDQNLKFKTNNSMKRELSLDSINLNELPSN